MLAGRLSDAALAETARELPVVVTGRTLKAKNLCALDFDDFEGARLATHRPQALGHQRIAFVAGDLKHPDGEERLRGYRSALAAADRLIDSREPFTAIFASNDQMAFGAGLGLHRRKLRVPDDVSLVGLDDLASAVYSIPPLTTVHHPVYELGRLAATAVLQLQVDQPTPTQALPMPRLMVRKSSRELRARRRR